MIDMASFKEIIFNGYSIKFLMIQAKNIHKNYILILLFTALLQRITQWLRLADWSRYSLVEPLAQSRVSQTRADLTWP